MRTAVHTLAVWLGLQTLAVLLAVLPADALRTGAGLGTPALDASSSRAVARRHVLSI